MQGYFVFWRYEHSRRAVIRNVGTELAAIELAQTDAGIACARNPEGGYSVIGDFSWRGRQRKGH